MNKHYFALLLLLFSVVGCGGNPVVTGKVTFADGTPLTEGEVRFETTNMVAKGPIQTDGTYIANSGDIKGVPKGTYQVSVGGFEPTLVYDPNRPDAPPKVIPPVIPIAKKHLSPVTSGLTLEVKGRTKFDITVEKP